MGENMTKETTDKRTNEEVDAGSYIEVDYRSKDYIGFAGEWAKGIRRNIKRGGYDHECLKKEWRKGRRWMLEEGETEEEFIRAMGWRMEDLERKGKSHSTRFNQQGKNDQ